MLLIKSTTTTLAGHSVHLKQETLQSSNPSPNQKDKHEEI